ncbi:hypothetical protein BU15DRAFT_82008 [Melanogaster broomeanus]|nr:hypothetical protein BU15DRAFT_82008 [Melanogaster broomeanus]
MFYTLRRRADDEEIHSLAQADLMLNPNAAVEKDDAPARHQHGEKWKSTVQYPASLCPSLSLLDHPHLDLASSRTRSLLFYPRTREKVERTREMLGLKEFELDLGQYKVFLSQAAFHSLKDHIRSLDVEEQKWNRLRDAEAEAGVDVRSIGDPYAPYPSPRIPRGRLTICGCLQPRIVTSTRPPHEYDERKSFRSDDFDARSRLTSNRDESNSNYGTESYAPSRNMFQDADKEGLIVKEALAGEIMENETTEVVKETSARRRWVTLMKREDVRQAWREKLALNMVIWFICGCAIFVIAILGMVICPTQHVFSTSELASHSYQNSPNNVYTSIRGEVFDLTQIAATHQRVVSVVPTKSVLQYGGTAADNLFPVQVSALCNGISGTVSPWVQLNSANNTDVNAQYHDFRAITNDSRPDWYFESMTRCTRVTNPQNPNATRQAASNAAADPTTPNAKSQQAHHTQEADEEDPQSVSLEGEQGDREPSDNDEAPQSMSLEGERGHELSDEAGPNPRPSRRVDSTSGQAAQAKWQVEGLARVEKTKDRIEGPEDEGQQVNRGGGKEVKNEDEEDSPSAPSTKPPSPSTSNQAPRPQGHR